jgi:hypothetical protein
MMEWESYKDLMDRLERVSAPQIKTLTKSLDGTIILTIEYYSGSRPEKVRAILDASLPLEIEEITYRDYVESDLRKLWGSDGKT